MRGFAARKKKQKRERERKGREINKAFQPSSSDPASSVSQNLSSQE